MYFAQNNGERILLDPSCWRRKYAKIKPVVNQVELHPHCQAGTGRDTSSLHTLCSEQGIVLEACTSILSIRPPVNTRLADTFAPSKCTTAR